MSRCRRATPELREIHGPSAIGGGRRRFVELLWLISLNEFKKTYFGTVLGYFWSLAGRCCCSGCCCWSSPRSSGWAAACPTTR